MKWSQCPIEGEGGLYYQSPPNLDFSRSMCVSVYVPSKQCHFLLIYSHLTSLPRPQIFSNLPNKLLLKDFKSFSDEMLSNEKKAWPISRNFLDFNF